MKNTVIGILAHVDAGKTTLAEAMLYLTGSIRAPGRVDRGDTHLDTGVLERERGMLPATRSMVSAPCSKHGFFVRHSLWTFSARPFASVMRVSASYAARACS